MPTPKKSVTELEEELADLLSAHEAAGHSVSQIEENYKSYESLRKKKKRRKKGLDRDERRHMKDLHPSWLMGSKIENKRRAIDSAKRREARAAAAVAAAAASESDDDEDEEEEEEEEDNDSSPSSSSEQPTVRPRAASYCLDALLAASATMREDMPPPLPKETTTVAEDDAAASGKKKKKKKTKKKSSSSATTTNKPKESKKKDPTPKERPEPVLGRPRSMSDPDLTVHLDDHGLLHVDGPAGWVGAYSPDSRKVRLQRFREKREHRVWEKRVKYDVRKSFAVSRLRVKGRFVKKEDEAFMRELMSLT